MNINFFMDLILDKRTVSTIVPNHHLPMIIDHCNNHESKIKIDLHYNFEAGQTKIINLEK